jgi:hypothetical protein
VPEDVVHVLHTMVDAVRPSGLVLDLQVIRPDPVVEIDGRVVCGIRGGRLFAQADAAVAAIDALIRTGELVEQGVDDHDVRKHYATGRDLVADFATKERRLPTEAMPMLEAHDTPCVVRERCRLRQLMVSDARARPS